jgi:hypothetical protein
MTVAAGSAMPLFAPTLTSQTSCDDREIWSVADQGASHKPLRVFCASGAPWHAGEEPAQLVVGRLVHNPGRKAGKRNLSARWHRCRLARPVRGRAGGFECTTRLPDAFTSKSTGKRAGSDRATEARGCARPSHARLGVKARASRGASELELRTKPAEPRPRAGRHPVAASRGRCQWRGLPAKSPRSRVSRRAGSES